MSRIHIDGPDGPEEVHLLREEAPPPFDQELFEVNDMLREMRREAKTDLGTEWMGYAMAAFFVIFGGAMLEQWDIDFEPWKALVWFAGSVVCGMVLAAVLRTGHGKVSDYDAQKLLDLRREARQAVEKGDAQAAMGFSQREADLRLKIYRQMIGR